MRQALRSFDVNVICRLFLEGLADIRLLLSIPLLAAGTYLLANMGVDAVVNDLARFQNGYFSIAWSALPMLGGMVMPLAIPFVFALKGKKQLANETMSAFLVALVVVSLLKGISSRVHPEALEPATTLARSQLFHFGFFESGFTSVVEGWPSGHVATNGAVSLVVIYLADSSLLKIGAIAWCFWVTLATVFGISGDVHWLSDTLAGVALAWIVAVRITKRL